MQTLLIGLSVALLAGCAAPTQKPVMQDSEYDVHATRWDGFNKCGRAGLLAPEIAALGLRYVEGDVSRFAYDVNRMNALVRAYGASGKEPTPADCNGGAMAVLAKKNQIEQNNAAIAADQKAWADAINNLPKRPIYCNRIGTQTVCQ